MNAFIKVFFAEVSSIIFSGPPLIKVKVGSDQLICKPLDPNIITFPKQKDIVLVLSLDYPINSRLFWYKPNLEEETESWSSEINALENIHSDIISLLKKTLSGEGNFIHNNFSSFIFFSNSGEVLIINKDNSKFFLRNGEILFTIDTKKFIRITSDKMDLINESNWIRLSNDYITVYKSSDCFLNIKNDKISLVKAQNHLTFTSDKITIGNSNNSITISNSGITIKGSIINITNGSAGFELLNHIHPTGVGPSGPSSTPPASPENPVSSDNSNSPPTNYYN